MALFSSLTTALEWHGDAFHCPSTITNRTFTEVSGLEKNSVSPWRSPESLCPQEVPRVFVCPRGGPQGLCVSPWRFQGSLCVPVEVSGVSVYPCGGPQGDSVCPCEGFRGLCVSPWRSPGSLCGPWRFQGSLCVPVGDPRAPGAPVSFSVFLSFSLSLMGLGQLRTSGMEPWPSEALALLTLYLAGCDTQHPGSRDSQWAAGMARGLGCRAWRDDREWPVPEGGAQHLLWVSLPHAW